MERAIVTGSNGQLGRTLQEFVLDGKNVVFDFFDHENLDITDKQSLDRIFKERKYNYCINCAGYTNVEQAEKTPEKAYKVNAEGVKNLAMACMKHKTILVHISTDYVFDGEKKGAYTIHDKTNPINEYGKSKLKGEEHIRALLPEHYIIRTSWLYSKKHGHNFCRTILKKAMAGEELRVTDLQIGCPTDTMNLSKFILEGMVFGKKPFGTYHFCDGEAMSWHGFAKKILRDHGLEETVELILDRNYRTFAKRPKNSVLA
ncbi:dTDP-4-dehydrorhamnose reductase [Flagellimonas meishanensis]|uniref:dTDP-4-dehydrorhamnose reductase n=1 Tax=Flagellimonas meishanensis TaxID=2873264 RepID=UPI001CA6BCAD|nr:dTDP-4-dehydrorhamnose reductase [[Muricauda] meishanensis]